MAQLLPEDVAGSASCVTAEQRVLIPGFGLERPDPQNCSCSFVARRQCKLNLNKKKPRLLWMSTWFLFGGRVGGLLALKNSLLQSSLENAF